MATTRYADKANLRELAAAVAEAIPSYGLSISGHTVSLVEGGGSGSVTVPDSDTTALGSMTGTLPVAQGGTGATTAAAARSALGLGHSLTITVGSQSVSFDGTADRELAIPSADGEGY